MKRSAAVVGGGIGGLAAGIALSRAGMEVTVYERAGEIHPLGAGLSIWPNGVRALRALGLDVVVDAPGVSHGGGALRRSDGSSLAEFDPSVIAERYGEPLVGLHRGALHKALIDGFGPDLLTLGKEVRGLKRDGLRFADGTEVQADLVVGADGLHSAMREEILGDGDPIDSGIVALRGVSAWDWPVPAGEWWGSESVAGLLPLPDGQVYWYLAHRGELDVESMPRLLDEYDEPLPSVVSATPASDVLCHRLYDREPVDSWSRGTAVLLGDAAHPMLPFLGQGACSALEDAVELGRAVSKAGDIAQAIEDYEAVRVGRTKKLVKGSRQAAKAALMSSGAGRRVRNTLISRVPASMRLRQLDPVITQGGSAPG
jgi:2-polyprenyl-6-methoxyphenol hydroxylase-like FAD-dependent oxidoreductase